MCSPPSRMHGRNAQTSTTAPRYLSLDKAEVAMKVDTAVAMGFEEEYIECRVAGRQQEEKNPDQPLSLSRRPAQEFRRVTCLAPSSASTIT